MGVVLRYSSARSCFRSPASCSKSLYHARVDTWSGSGQIRSAEELIHKVVAGHVQPFWHAVILNGEPPHGRSKHPHQAHVYAMPRRWCVGASSAGMIICDTTNDPP